MLSEKWVLKDNDQGEVFETIRKKISQFVMLTEHAQNPGTTRLRSHDQQNLENVVFIGDWTLLRQMGLNRPFSRK